MKRVRSFAAWISSFTFCCCCFPRVPVGNPEPIVINMQQPQINVQPPKTEKTSGKKTPDDQPPDIGGGQPTRANFEKIKENMTLAQVRALLGPGTEDLAGKAGKRRTYRWVGADGADGPIFIEVIFDNNKMVSRKLEAN
ncbi:MAG: hypothetical protein HY289_09505 [Planctomycetes bacterium]|nr:hypothetical protein [Planctomycetota bacterium]